MSVTTGQNLTVGDLAQPSTSPPMTLSGKYLPPKQQIFFCSPDEWEEFILEWATGLSCDNMGNSYVQVKRLGGTGDAGIDVAAFKSTQQLEGPWDCFQCKHYAASLTLGDAATEILKVCRHVLANDYVLPDRYVFMAPQGAGTQLNRLLSTPSQLRAKFLGLLDTSNTLVKGLSSQQVDEIREFASTIDFSVFEAAQLHEVLDAHATTKYHAARFGTPLPTRSALQAPPATVADIEAQYVSELRQVYAEKDPGGVDDATVLMGHPTHGSHFQRQRVSFYKAESLRMDARDAVPDGTFEALQDDVYDGVIDMAEAIHPSRWDRLNSVLAHSTALSLGPHPLVSITRRDDIKGICHQLVNDRRLTWSEKAP